jgi:DNA-binding NtrC family response regulator
MRNAKRILNVSYDSLLLQTRSAILVQAGHEVSEADNFRQASRLFQAYGFDLVIIGHSLPVAHTRLLAGLARRAGARILHLIRPGDHPSGTADLIFSALEGPAELLRAVDSVLACDSEAAAA